MNPTISPETVKRRIEAALPGARVTVGTFSGNDHFEATVEAPQFAGLSLVEQHRKVYAALDDLIGGPMHALALKTPGTLVAQMRVERTTMNQAEWTETFKRDIAENPILVYAKGEKNMAACGFSHRVMQVFNALGVDYTVRNVFSHDELRPALCAFTNWPTTPQIFVGGEFVGGCDIVEEMYRSGELQKLIETRVPRKV